MPAQHDHGLDLFELEISVRVEPVETLRGLGLCAQ